MKNVQRIAAAILALTLVALAHAQGDGQALRDLATRWQELYNAGDHGGVANLYTEDAVFLGSDGQVYEGRNAILGYLEAPLPVPPGEGTVEVDTNEVELFGDVGFATGTYAFTAEDGTEMMRGSWMTLDRLVDGEWRIYRHASNFVPPATTDGEDGG